MKGLSLFTSGGIDEFYLDKTCVNMVLGNELLQKRCDFFKQLYPHKDIICGSITDKKIYQQIVEKSKQKKIDFIIATPPCQGMSKAGKMKFDDPRNSLFLYIISLAKQINPKYMLIENVPEFIKFKFLNKDKREEKIIDKLVNELGSEYEIKYKVLNTQNYGVPQNRKRAIVLFSRKDMNIWRFPKSLNTLLTVRDTIEYLPSLKNNQRLCLNDIKKLKISDIEKKNIIRWHYAKHHNERHILWMKHTPSGKSAFLNENKNYVPNINGRVIRGFKTTYKRIQWDKPCPTITMANGSISSQNNVHPGRELKNGEYSDPRVLSIYELLLLSSFPRNIRISENTNDKLIRDLLGECVPPLFMFYIINNIPRK